MCFNLASTPVHVEFEMSSCAHRFIAEICSLDGEPRGELPLTADWEQALQWTHFEGVRRGLQPPTMHYDRGSVEPIWDDEFGRPFVGAIRVIVGDDDTGYCEVIPTTYLAESVQRESSKLVSDGRLAPGERFTWRIYAVVDTALDSHPHDQSSPLVERVCRLLPIEPRGHGDMQGNAAVHSPMCVHAVDIPIYIDRFIVDEIRRIAGAAPDTEVGGVLVGWLCRDPATEKVFVEVRAQIQATHVRARRDSLTFTPQTWAVVQQAIELRNQNELFVGWWHSHPFFCRKCPPQSRRLCRFSEPFFSETDCALHRTVFGRPFDVALLVSDIGDTELAMNLYGWRHGMIQERGFQVLHETTAAAVDTERSEGAEA